MGTDVASGIYTSHSRRLARDFVPTSTRGLTGLHQLPPRKCHHRPFVSVRRAGEDVLEVVCLCTVFLMTSVCTAKTLHAQTGSLNLNLQGTAVVSSFVELHQRPVPASARLSVRRSFSSASSRCESFLYTAMIQER